MLHCAYCGAAWVFSMSEIVDQALRCYELVCEMDPEQIERLRERTSRYIEKLMSAGQRDRGRLTEYANAYLKENCWRDGIRGSPAADRYGLIL